MVELIKIMIFEFGNEKKNLESKLLEIRWKPIGEL